MGAVKSHKSVRRFLPPTALTFLISALAHASVIVTTIIYANRSVSGGAKEVGIFVESWDDVQNDSPTHSHRRKQKTERALAVQKDGETSAQVAPNEQAGEEEQAESHSSSPGTVYGEEEVDSPVKMLRPPVLRYPSAAYRDGLEGEVELFLVVDEAGKVVEMETVHESSHVFNRAALDAAKTLQFIPAKKEGVPVRVHVHWTCRFRLE